MSEFHVRLLVVGLVAAWLLQRLRGSQPLADHAERPARLAVSRWGSPAGVLAAVLWGCVLGFAASAARDGLAALATEFGTFYPTTILFGLNVLVLLGALRAPARRDASPETLARRTLTPWLLFALGGPGAAYAYRCAAAALEESGEPGLLQQALAVCDWLPKTIAGLAWSFPQFSTARVEEGRRPASPWARLGWGLAAVAVASGAAVLLARPMLAYEGFYWSSEGIAFAHRLWGLDSELRRGVLYPRLYTDFARGFGYPFPNFYAPLSYYLGELLHRTGLGYIGAAKGVAVLIFAGAALAMFSLTAARFSGPASLVAAAAYATSGYLLFNVYGRGDLAEALCFAWIPLCVGQIMREPGPRPGIRAAACALPVALLTLTHNITAMLTMPLLLGMALLPWRRGPRSPAAAAGIALGLGLACFFWLPALAEKQFVSTERMVRGNYNFFRNFVEPQDFLALAGEPIGRLEGGAPLFFLALLGILAVIQDRVLASRAEPCAWWMVVLLAGSLAMMHPASEPVWRLVPLLRYVQFPWRLMVFACVSLAYLAAVGVSLILEAGKERRAPLNRLILISAAVTLAPAVLVLLHRLKLPPGEPGTAAAARIAAVLLLSALALFVLQPRMDLRIASLLLPAAAVVSSLALGAWNAAGSHRPLPVAPDAFDLEAFHRAESDSQYLGTTARGEYLPRWAPARRRPNARPGELALDSGTTSPVELLRGYRRRWQVEAEPGTRATFGSYYFPGWQAWIDGHSVPVSPSRDGLVTFAVPPRRHIVIVDFVDTPVRKAAWGFSGAAALALLAGVLIPLTPPGRRGPRERKPAANST